jgi:outer membrane protein assembly factor BamB
MMQQTRISSRSLTLVLAVALSLGLGGCKNLFGSDDEAETPTLGNRTPILSRVAAELAVDPQLASVTVVVPPAEANTDWTQSGRNAAKATGHLALGAAPARAWQATIAGTSATRRLAASPVIGDGKLFAVDSSGVIHAFAADTGRSLWTHTIVTTRDLRDATFGGGATYSEGRVYATSGTGDVVALDAGTGAEVWRKKPAGPLRGSPTVANSAV